MYRLLLLTLLAACSGGSTEETAAVDSDTDADTDADTDSDTDADTDSDTDADTDSDTDADTDSDTDTDVQAAPTSCLDILNAGDSTGDGTYVIDVDGDASAAPITVYCDMTTEGGGWMLTTRLSDDTYTFVVEGETSGTPGLTGNYTLNVTGSEFPIAERLVRWGTLPEDFRFGSSTVKFVDGHGTIEIAGGYLQGSNAGSAAGCGHLYAGPCNQNGDFSCFGTAVGGRQRSAETWCSSAWVAPLAVFAR